MGTNELSIQVPYQDWSGGLNIDDIEEFRSVMRSKRRIKRLRIYFDSSETIQEYIMQRLKKILGVIGQNISEIIINSNRFTWKELALLNMMPNLQKLHLSIQSKKPLISKNLCLRLNDLRELSVICENADILEIFNQLPDNILRKLTLNTKNNKKTYFENQQKIEEINTNLMIILCSDKPKKTTILDAKFRYQKEIDQVGQFESLIEICVESRAFLDLSNLENLKNLKKFTLLYNIEDGFDRMIDTLKSESLESLDVIFLSKPSLLHVKANCPNLRELEIEFNHGFLADEVLRKFPKLESFHCKCAILRNVQSYEHHNLKTLDIECGDVFSSSGNYKFDDILNFLRGCKNLESFSMKYGCFLTAEELKDLLQCCRKLKTLCIQTKSKKLFTIIRKHGKNIRCLHVSRRNRIDLEKIEWENFKKYLDGQFQHLSANEFGFLMTKPANVEKCCNWLWNSIF